MSSHPSSQQFKPIVKELPLPGVLPPIVMAMQDQLQREASFQRWITEPEIRGGVSPNALDKLGVRLCLEKRYADSIKVLAAAVAMQETNIAIINNLAVVLERAGQSDDAVGCVERSLGLARNQPDSWIFLGSLRQNQGDLIGAKTAYHTAIELSPESPLAWQGLGLIEQRQRDYAGAIESIKNCIRYGYAPAAVLAVLGQLFYAIGEFEKARDAYAAALESDPSNQTYRQVYDETKLVCRLMLLDQAAIDDFVTESCNADVEPMLQKVYSLLGGYNHLQAARIVAEKWRSLFPNSATANYLFHASQGDGVIPRSPDQFLIECFDKVADRFDQHLVEILHYDIPEKLGEAIEPFISDGRKLDVLDAGCGTGLCGPVVRDFSTTLTGVDLSPKMLERASQRKVYDKLICSEITKYLLDHPNSYDLIIAADVIIYFGDLLPLRDAFASALRSGGLLAFSTESSETGYALRTSGRFAHEVGYVRSVFTLCFEICVLEQTQVRLEASQPVPGNLYVFRLS